MAAAERDDLATLAPEAIRLARTWAAGRAAAPVRPQPEVPRAEQRATARLGALVRDPAGLGFALGFVDRVARPEDLSVAARQLARLATGPAPSFLSRRDRALLRLARLAPLAPWPAVPMAKARLRAMVGDLVVDARPDRLTRFLERARDDGYRTNLNLLGEAVLGDGEASRRAAATARLIATPGVDTVSVKVSSLVSNLSPWDHEGNVGRVVQALVPLLRAASAHGVAVALDMEEYRHLAITLDAFESVALLPESAGVPLTLALQAYLPDVDDAVDRVLDVARRRSAPGSAGHGSAGAADLKIRLVKGANLAMEHVDAVLHGWTEPTYGSKPEVDAAYVRVLDRLLTGRATAHTRVGVAGHNLYHLALAVLLGRARGVADRIEIEMLHGMAPVQAAAVLADTGAVLLYTPVVAAEDFDVAVAYLTRRLEEASAPQNVVHTLVADRPDLGPVEAAFAASVRDAPAQQRTGRRPRREEAWQRQRDVVAAGGFANAPDSDPTDPATRAWVRAALSDREAVPRPALITSTEAVDDAVSRARAAHRRWRAWPAQDRARALRTAADRLEAHRGRLLAVMAHEAGKTVTEADPELSEAIDFARWCATCAESTLTTPLARFRPVPVTLVVPPWNFPVAIPLGGVFAALAAGSAAVLKPAPQTPRCAHVAARLVQQALDDAGAPPDLLTVLDVPEDDVGRHLVTHRGVGRVVLTGALETAATFLGWRPDLPLLAETSGKNAVVVTPSADLDLAVADVVRSAFGHAGQKCSAASLLILVGSLASSVRFRRQLVDAVTSLPAGPGTEPGALVGPLIEPPRGKLLRALTTLEPGESWLVEPTCLSGDDRLWRPGVRLGVRPGSFFHRVECFGPVLGVMAARDLDEAIEWQNTTGFALTGGIHSLDDDEVARWLDRVQVGNAYVNRGITGAVVRRQPFGGWDRSVAGPGAKPGGPDYVAQFGDWQDQDDVAALSPDDWLAAASRSDREAWAEQFGVEHDPSGLDVESNVLRYRPVPRLTVRVGSGAAPYHVVRVMRIAARAGVPVVVSHRAAESDRAFAARVAAGEVSGRVRVVGAAPGLREAAAGRVGEVTVLDHPVLAEGRREGLTVLREQSVSRTVHRFGHILPSG